MTYVLTTPQKFKYKRFAKRYSRIEKIMENTFNQVKSGGSFICGIKCLEGGFLKVTALHQHILLLRRAIGKGRVGWPRLRMFLNIRCPMTEKSAGHRMGKGKGAVRYWGLRIRKGAFLFKIKKSPFKFSYIDSISWGFLYALTEFIETYGLVMSRIMKVQLDETNEINLNYFMRQHLIGVTSLTINTLLTGKNKKIRSSKLLTLLLRRSKRLYHTLFSSHKADGLNNGFLYRNYLTPINKIIWSSLIFISHYLKNRRRVLKNAQTTTGVRVRHTRYIYQSVLLRKQFLENRIIRQGSLKDLYVKEEAINFDFEFIDSKAYFEKFQKYPDHRISHLPSLFRGLTRIKRKLPFRSEVVFFSSKFETMGEMFKKKETLKHINQR